MKTKHLLFVLLIPFFSLLAQETSQTFLSLKQTGVEDFLKKYSEYDGRGTIIMVFDTGVDMGLDGLDKTTTGEVKVIDAQDFTGQGDASYFEADVDDEDGIYFFINEDKNYKVNGADKLSIKAADDEYYIGMIEEKLWLNSGSGVTDVNGNGTEDDKFYFVTFKTKDNGEEYWVVYFDTNANGDLSDEEAIRNYKDQLKPFFIPNEKGVPNFTFALNIFPAESKVVFYFDDGSHGTNCAGIASGNKIGGSEFYGVAPGAYVIGLKLGNNNFSGGATVTESMKKCFEYAAKVAAEKDEPCVINMSFGVGSEIEGHADMEKFIDKWTKENPYIHVCLSNGNNGPGISCTGLPTSTRSVISSGAVLTKEVAGDLYGVRLNRDIILGFSSRGGEVLKPDIVSPGASFATIPNYDSWDGMAGTSMASPYTAGVISLLLSAAKVEFPEVKIPAQFMKKVLKESGTKMDGYVHLDQGGGLINVGNAWELLKKYIKTGELKNFETYSISSTAPNMPNDRADNLYLRNGSFVTGKERFTYTISRDNTIGKDKFYRIYDLKSDSEWLKLAQKRVHIRNEQNAFIDVNIDKSFMTEPGLYNGMITGYRQGTSIPEFQTMATLVIPYRFSFDNHYRMKWNDVKVDQGMFKRYFLEVPAGATCLKIKVSADADEYARIFTDLYDPDGISVSNLGLLSSYTEENEIVKYIYNLEPGVYELDVYSLRNATDDCYYNLSVEFNGINRLDDNVLGDGDNKIDVVDYFSEVDSYNLTGEILGYRQSQSFVMKSYEIKEIPFELRKGEKSKTFNIAMTKEDYIKTTDFAVMILDEKGKALRKGGISAKSSSISIQNRSDAESTKYVLQLIPAFALGDAEAIINIDEVTEFSNAASVTVKNDGRDRITFYPTVKEEITVEFSKPDNFMPKDSKPYGKIYFKTRNNNEKEFELPVFFKF